MVTINTYERIDGTRHERDTWEVPSVFEGFRFPEELSVHQVAILEDLATSEDFDAEIADLRNSWGLSRLNANEVISAFIQRRDDKVSATNPQKALLRRMLMALSKSDVPEGFYAHLFPVMMGGNDPQTRAAINEARATIAQAQSVGWSVAFDVDQRSSSSQNPPSENIEQLVEKTF